MSGSGPFFLPFDSDGAERPHAFGRRIGPQLRALDPEIEALSLALAPAQGACS
jgi:hypothetical protein